VGAADARLAERPATGGRLRWTAAVRRWIGARATTALSSTECLAGRAGCGPGPEGLEHDPGGRRRHCRTHGFEHPASRSGVRHRSRQVVKPVAHRALLGQPSLLLREVTVKGAVSGPTPRCSSSIPNWSTSNYRASTPGSHDFLLICAGQLTRPA